MLLKIFFVIIIFYLKKEKEKEKGECRLNLDILSWEKCRYFLKLVSDKLFVKEYIN